MDDIWFSSDIETRIKLDLTGQCSEIALDQGLKSLMWIILWDLGP